MVTGNQDIDPNKENRNIVSKASKVLENTLANFSMGAVVGETVGSGYRAINPERLLSRIAEIEKKKKNADKLHRIALSQIRARIAELDEKIAEFEKIAEEAQENIDRLEDELSGLEEGGPEYIAKQREIEEQKRIRDEALTSARILKEERDLLLKIKGQALETVDALDAISQRGASLKASVVRVVSKMDTAKQKMSDAGMDQVAIIAIMNGTYVPRTVEEKALVDEYENLQDELVEINVEIDVLDEKTDAVHELIRENQKTRDGQVQNNVTFALASENDEGIEGSSKLLEAAGATEQKLLDTEFEYSEMETDFGSELGNDLFNDDLFASAEALQVAKSFKVAAIGNSVSAPAFDLNDQNPAVVPTVATLS